MYKDEVELIKQTPRCILAEKKTWSSHAVDDIEEGRSEYDSQNTIIPNIRNATVTKLHIVITVLALYYLRS